MFVGAVERALFAEPADSISSTMTWEPLTRSIRFRSAAALDQLSATLGA